jgi:hypothetical protein
MAWLKIYEWERTTYPEFQNIRVDRPEKYLKKFARHFKVNQPTLARHQSFWVAYRVKKSGGTYRSYDESIDLANNISLGILIHEFTHHLDWKINHKVSHDKKFKRQLKRVYTFAKRYLPKGLCNCSPLIAGCHAKDCPALR